MGTLHALPTAAAKPVRQPVAYAAKTRPLRRQLRAEGRLLDLPADHHIRPDVRAALAAKEANRATYEAGGVRRDGTFFLLASLLQTLPAAHKAELVANLRFLAKAFDDDASRAALLLAETFTKLGEP